MTPVSPAPEHTPAAADAYPLTDGRTARVAAYDPIREMRVLLLLQRAGFPPAPPYVPIHAAVRCTAALLIDGKPLPLPRPRRAAMTRFLLRARNLGDAATMDALGRAYADTLPGSSPVAQTVRAAIGRAAS